MTNNVSHGVRVLSIGTDTRLFEEGSAVRARQAAYAERLGFLHIIVLTTKNDHDVVERSLQVTPTASGSKLMYGLNAWLVARRLPKPDVVTAQDPFETGLAAWWISRSLGAPLHVQVHTDFTSHEFARASFRNWVRQRIAWFVLKRAARIRCVLGRTADDIRARGIQTPVTVLPIYVDLARFASIPRTKHPRWKIALLCVGRLEKEKRFDLAIHALARTRREGHDAGLTIVGSGSEEGKLRALARNLALETRVEFVGWKNDLTPYYSSADIVLVPSRFEGYGMAIVEALAAGIPVLATDVGVAREAGAIVVKPSDFPQALVRWIENGPRTASLAQVPYGDEKEYVERYCKDIQATARK